MTKKLQNQLRLPFVRKEKLVIHTFAAVEGSLKELDVYHLCVKGKKGANVYIEALCTPFICSSLEVPSSEEIKCEYGYFGGLEIAQSPEARADVDILVGLDYYFSFISGNCRRGPPGCPVAMESTLGWLVCGPTVKSGSGCSLLINMAQVKEDLVEPYVRVELSLGD